MKLKPIDLLILAAGSGHRFGGDKMQIKIDGCWPSTLVQEQALASRCFNHIYQIGKEEGGPTRSESIRNGLKLSIRKSASSAIAIVDAARFLITASDFQSLLEGWYCRSVDALAFARPLTNSIIHQSTERLSGQRRDAYHETHTPHIFKKHVLWDILQAYQDDQFPDEFSYAVDSSRYRCSTIPGNWRTAMKLTYAEDLAVMEALYHAHKKDRGSSI